MMRRTHLKKSLWSPKQKPTEQPIAKKEKSACFSNIKVFDVMGDKTLWRRQKVFFKRK